MIAIKGPEWSRDPTRMGRSAPSESRSVCGIAPSSLASGSMKGPRNKKFMTWAATRFNMMVDRISLTPK